MAKSFIFIFSIAAFSMAPAGIAFAAADFDGNAPNYLVVGGIAAGIGCLLFGLVLIGRGRRSRRIGRESGLWPMADGTILTATVAKSSGGQNRLYHVPRVTYSYAVGSRQYVGNVIFPGIEQFGLGSNFQSHARADRYPVGKIVTVHYDPGDPTVAVLEPTEIGGARNIFGGAILLLLGVSAFALAVVFGMD